MKFVPNPDFEVQMQREVEYRANVVRIAEECANLARLIAPFRASDKGKHYRDSISVLADIPNVFLRSTDWKAWMLEYGTHHHKGDATWTTPTFATLRRAVLMSGLRLDESRSAG